MPSEKSTISVYFLYKNLTIVLPVSPTQSELSSLTLISCKTHITRFYRCLSGTELGMPENSKHPFLECCSSNSSSDVMLSNVYSIYPCSVLLSRFVVRRYRLVMQWKIPFSKSFSIFLQLTSGKNLVMPWFIENCLRQKHTSVQTDDHEKVKTLYPHHHVPYAWKTW